MTLAMKDLPHYTYDDYVEWEGKWELIEGVPYAMAPAPSFEHQSISQKIAYELQRNINDCKYCRALLPVDWQIAEDTVVQPDNLVVCGPVHAGKKLSTTPRLIFEILSPATARKDRGLKYRLYEAAGVRYYAIVSPLQKSTDIYKLEDGKYTLVFEADEKSRFVFDVDEGCRIDFDFTGLFE